MQEIKNGIDRTHLEKVQYKSTILHIFGNKNKKT